MKSAADLRRHRRLAEHSADNSVETLGRDLVGAGNSGAEIALDVVQHHPTWLSGRDPGQEPTVLGACLTGS